MSNCSNCYNGCTEIVSDRCVKYTGIDVPVLGIQTGDSLSFVEQALITFLVSTLDGTGIKIDLTGIDICALVQANLPTCGDISIVDISKAFIASACDLQEQVDAIVADIVVINNDINVIEADYTVRCLIEGTPSITPSSGTHAILQATIDTLCALVLELHTNYSSNGTELDNYIANYLATQGGGGGATKYYNRMIPYAVVEYYGPIPGNFDATGAGLATGLWEKIYLCNGQNGTPDKRGRVGVGTTDGSMLGLTLPIDTNPGSSSFNPLYTLGGSAGTSNQTVLGETQIPAHTHIGTIASGGAHTHNTQYGEGGAGTLYPETPYVSDIVGGVAGLTTSSGIHTHSISIASTGGNLAHSNVQVGLGCYYIQYRP
jgi:hypothetical protein